MTASMSFPVNTSLKPAIDENAYQSYLAALLKGDRAECARIVQGLASSGADLKSLYLRLFQRALYAVGELWERQQISVAVEHLATAITERMLTLVQPLVFSGGGPKSRSIVVVCTAGEFHQIGGRMIADLCELSGWRGYFLGADTSLDEILRTIALRRPSMLGLSLALLTNLPSLLKAIDVVRADHPRLPIVVGGQAFRFGGQEALQAYPEVSYVASFSDLEKRLASFEP